MVTTCDDSGVSNINKSKDLSVPWLQKAPGNLKTLFRIKHCRNLTDQYSRNDEVRVPQAIDITASGVLKDQVCSSHKVDIYGFFPLDQTSIHMGKWKRCA